MATSRLFNIDPIGVGTPYVESLPSYIKRLAEAHSVYPGILLINEIFPEIRGYELDLYLRDHKKLLLSISSDITKDLIQVLETKTNSNNIHNISLSKLSGYINDRNLIRDHAAWCPICYEESRLNNNTVYEQLIWSISDINFCGKHSTRLHQICPQCHKNINHYNPLGRIGYCHHCKFWLGLDNLDSNSYYELKKWDTWVIDNIGSILSDIPKLSVSAEAYLSENITSILNHTGMSKRKLAEEIAVSKLSVYNWINKYKKPTLSSVLLISLKFGIPINKLLFEQVNGKNISIDYFKVRTNIERPKIAFIELQQSMKRALASTELIAINRLAKEYKVEPRTIKKHFPIEYHLLKQKYIREKEERELKREAQIRDMMFSLNKRGIFPCVYRVSHELGFYIKPGRRYHNVWISTLRELGYTGKNGSV